MVISSRPVMPIVLAQIKDAVKEHVEAALAKMKSSIQTQTAPLTVPPFAGTRFPLSVEIMLCCFFNPLTWSSMSWYS